MDMKRDIFLAALAAILLTACGEKKETYKVEPLTVVTETVSAGNAPASITYVGKVEEESSTPVSFTGMGTVNKVYVEEGQYVAKGQPVAEMDPTQCENTLEAAKATLTQAQDAQERMKVLYESQSISEIDWVSVNTKLRTAQSGYQMAGKALADCHLKAPCSGIVGKKQMESGMTALPSQPVCTILDITRVKVKIAVPEKEIALFGPELGKGEGATVTAEALGGKTFRTAKFVRSVQGDALTHTYDVRFTLSNPGGELLPGMVVSVALPLGTDAGAATLTVPVRSIQQSSDGQHFVWLEKNGKASRQPVGIGQVQGDRIVVESGLREGDKVIVEGYQKVSEGSEITTP